MLTSTYPRVLSVPRGALATLALVALVSMTAGCATRPPPPAAPDPAQVALQQALSRAAILPAHADYVDAEAAPAVTTGDSITIRSYVGDAANLLRRVAIARGMKFTITGPQPHLPLFVAVDVQSVRFEDFLKGVSYQFGQRANLVLGDGLIEIRYRGQS